MATALICRAFSKWERTAAQSLPIELFFHPLTRSIQTSTTSHTPPIRPKTLASTRYAVFREQVLKPKLYDLILEVARRAPLFLTPARQPFVNLTSGAIPLYSEDFRGWLSHQLIAENLPFPSPVTSCRVLRQLDEDAHHLPHVAVHPAHLGIESTPRGYFIDLKKGTDPIHLTGKHWQQEPNPTPAFFRPETNHTLTRPSPSKKPLNTHLSQAFDITEAHSAQLAQWLQLAMRPDQPCPLLIITGTHRDEATRAIRELIDPGTCAILPLPVTQNQMGEMALFNRASGATLGLAR